MMKGAISGDATYREAALATPEPIRERLKKVKGRLRSAAAARGLGTLLAVLTICAATAMASDLIKPMHQWIRSVVWFAWVGVALMVVWRRIASKLISLPRDWELAALVERSHPEFHEELSGAVSLLSERRHGSSALIAAAAEQASTRIEENFDLETIAPMRSSRNRLGVGLALTAALAAAIAFVPDPCERLFKRFINPWSGVDPVSKIVFEVQPGDVRLPLHSDLSVHAKLTPRFGATIPKDASIEIVEGKTSRPIAMALLGNATTSNSEFEVVVAKVPRSFMYRIKSGREHSRWLRAKAVERPKIERLKVSIEPADYTGFKKLSLENPKKVEVLSGSRVTFELQTKAPIKSASVYWRMNESESAGQENIKSADAAVASSVPLEKDGVGKAWRSSFTAVASGSFTFALEDENGFANERDAVRDLRVVKDLPPEVNLKLAQTFSQARADDSFAARINAADDIAVVDVVMEFMIERKGLPADDASAVKRIPLKLSGLGTMKAAGPALVPFASLGVAAGDVLRFRARAQDGLPKPAGPQYGYSKEFEIEIVAKGEPLYARARADLRKSIAKDLEAIKKLADENRRETEQLRYAADAARRDPAAWNAEGDAKLTNREEQARRVEDKLEELASKVDDQPALAAMAELARETARVEAEAARESLAEARRKRDPQQRLEKLQQADPRLAATQTRVDQLRNQFDKLVQVDQSRDKIEELAQRERELAAKAGELAEQKNGDQSPLDRAQLDQIQAGQEQVRKELESELNRTPELKSGMLRDFAARARDLAKQARQTAQLQRDEALKTTEPDRISAELKAITKEQQQVAADARKFGLEVDIPLSENQRQGLDANAVRSPLETLNRGDVNDSRLRMQYSTNELRRLADDLRDVRSDPKLALRRLARRQDALAREANEALSNLDRDPKNEPARAEITRRLEPIVKRQAEIAKIANAIEPQANAPENAKQAVKNAVSKAHSALDTMQHFPIKELDQRIGESRNAFNHAADAFKDPRDRRNQSRGPAADHARTIGDIARDSENILREASERLAREPGLNREQFAKETQDRLRPLAQRAREAVKRLEEPDVDPRVLPARARASAASRELAEALDHNDREKIPQAAAVARALAERAERAIHSQLGDDEHAAELADDQRRLAADAKDAVDPAELAKQQSRIASALENLDAPEAKELQKQSVQAARTAAKALDNQKAGAKLDATAEKALAETAKLAESLAQKLNPPITTNQPTPPKPIADPALALDQHHQAEVQALARRQERLLERLASLGAERTEPQRDLNHKAAELAQELRKLGRQAAPLSQRAEGPSREAADVLDHQARPAMEQASRNLAQGNLDQARNEQNRSSDLVEAAARRAEDLASALRAEAPDNAAHANGAHEGTGEPSPLGEARGDLDRASAELAAARDSQSSPQSSAARAAEAMRQAADHLQAAVQSSQLQEGDADSAASRSAAKDPSQSKSTPNSDQAGVANADLEKLQDLVKSSTGRSWGELPGHLRTEILKMSRQDRYRDDYQSLIRLYFRQIAAGVAAGKEGE